MRTRPTSRRYLVAASLALATVACRQDMHDQPKYTPLRASTFFADGSSARPLPEGTVARGHLREDTLLYTGKVGDEPSTEFPFPLTPQVMRRGQEAFNAYCSHCHGMTGEGDGMVVQRGYTKPPAFYSDKVREKPIGHIFDVITNGFGAMPDHAAQVKVNDRWAIAAYVRALQASAAGSVTDVPADQREQLDRPAGAAPAGAAGHEQQH
ncbi:MAG: cytochrome c [Vicinamibacterales bacterium]